jgi:CRP-like cAMP-binding protein
MAETPPRSTIETRRDQMLSTLAHAEIARIRRFGELRHFHDGELLFETGQRGLGMFVLVSGRVAASHGLAHSWSVEELLLGGPGKARLTAELFGHALESAHHHLAQQGFAAARQLQGEIILAE